MVVGDTFGNLRYYKNTGTAIAPVFSLQNGAANPFNGVDIGSKSAPTFADLDGDGDLDAIIGADAGTLSYYKNTGTAIAPVFSLQSGAANPFDTVDLAGFSMPVFVDLDGDGDLDAAVGNNSSGLVKYFQNIGSATSPVLDFNTGNITGIDAGVDSHPSFAELRRRRRPRRHHRRKFRHPEIFREHRHGRRGELRRAHRVRQSVQRR